MQSAPAFTAIFLALAVSQPGAGQPPSQTPAPAPQEPRGSAMPNLGRPTQQGDETPPLDIDRFLVGKWNFEWIVPESPLGPAGQIGGTTTFKAVDGRFYQVETDAKGPSGPIKIRERLAYHKENKTLTRYVTDSRGFSYLTLASVGSDLGGFYYMYFEGEPFTYKGKTIRLRENWRLTSPVAYKVSMTVSVDGGPFTNYGNPWWQKQLK